MRRSERRIIPEPWPPPKFRLPDTIEEIKRGRIEPVRQRDMFDNTPEARHARLTGGTTETGPPGFARLRFWRPGRYSGPRQQAAPTGPTTGRDGA